MSLIVTKGKKILIAFAKHIRNATTLNYSELKIHIGLQLFEKENHPL